LFEAPKMGALGRLDTMTLPTWTGKSHFKYEGSVGKGTQIWFGKNEHPVTVSASQYAKLLAHFKGQEVPVGTSRDKPQPGSLGEWLQENVTATAIASYVAPILVKERYVLRATDRTKIKFN
jgi:hypothetical protein